MRKIILTLLLLVSGCVLRPNGADIERDLIDQAGERYRSAASQPTTLPADASWEALLRYAFYHNGDLESAYHAWAAAYHRIDQEATWPDSNIEVGYSYMFSDENLKSWDRTTLGATFDETPMLPNKIAKQGEIALAEARAAGARFAAKKFQIQREVLTAWLDLALQAEKVRIARDNVELLQLLTDTAETRVEAGAAQQDLIRAQIELRLAEDELASMQSEQRRMGAMLSAAVGQVQPVEIVPPTTLPAPRVQSIQYDAFVKILSEQSPELAALAAESRGAEQTIEAARLRWWPDINLEAAITGDVSRMLGAAVMLPTVFPAIRAQIRESESNLAGIRAMARQKYAEQWAQGLAALIALENAERQQRLLSDDVLPASERLLDTVRRTYATGGATFLDLIEAQRTLLDVRRMVAVARIEREKSLVELESIVGVDAETLVEKQP